MYNIVKQLVEYSIRRGCESFYIGIARKLHTLRSNKASVDVNKYREFIVNTEELVKSKRLPGISGFYRVKNEEYLLEASVESHIEYLDEIIIVYNNCSDNTPDIAKKLQKKYPDKIKVYEYVPDVYPVLSRKHMLEPGKSPHSIVNFYNFTLSKTTKDVVVKIDADHIVVKNVFAKAVQEIRSNGMQGGYHFFHGVNIFECGSKICINKKNPFTYGLDCGFFKIGRGMYFVHRRKYESLKIPLRVYFKKRDLGVLFYHLKGFKKDRGTAFMDNVVNDSKAEMDKIKDIQFNPELIKWSKFNADEVRGVPYPGDMLRSILK